MIKHNVATRSIRRRRRAASRVSSLALGRELSALQIFVFRGETFLGTELFDASRPIMVGRHADTQLRLDGESVSRYHCRLSVVADQVFVEDLDSGNGTLLHRCRLTQRTRVDGQAVIHVGPYSLRVKLLAAPGPRPYDPAKGEDTTKINAILAAERTGGTDEVAVESHPSLNEALYREAIRRTTGGGTRPADPKAHVPSPAPQLSGPLEDDSTQMPAQDVVLAPRPVVSSPEGPDPAVEARLKDLDALIASLEAEDRRPSIGPWRSEYTAPTTTDFDASDAFVHSEASGPIDTREFARDLASRLALDGQVVGDMAPVAPPAQVIALRTSSPTPIPSEVMGVDEDPTEAEDHDPEVDAILAAAAELDDENPETELMDDRLPPRPVPQVVAPVPAAAPVPPPAPAPPAAPVVRERAQKIADPAGSDSGPQRVPPPKGLSIPGRRPPAPSVAAPAPVRKRSRHEARLMTPTSLRVDVKPVTPAEDSLLDDVWTKTGASPANVPSRKPAAAILQRTVRPTPPPLPKRSRPSVTGARPQSRIDDFSEALEKLPATPVPMHFDGIEVSARVDGRLVDIAVLRKAGEEYILGHRTPQGAIAPARAHVGLRLVRMNPDDTVDLVFPKDVGGHLVRGQTTATFASLSEGRKYSCLRLETQDLATVMLGAGQDVVTYHVRFLRRPKSLFRSLRGLADR